MPRSEDSIEIISDDDVESQYRKPRKQNNERKPNAKHTGKAENRNPRPIKRYASTRNGRTANGDGRNQTEQAQLNNKRPHGKKNKVLGHKGSLRGFPRVHKGSLRGSLRSDFRKAESREQKDNKIKNSNVKSNHKSQANAKAGQRKRTNAKAKNHRSNHHKGKGKARSTTSGKTVRSANSRSDVSVASKKGGKHKKKKKTHGSTDKQFICPCMMPFWGSVLIIILVIILTTVAVGIVFLINTDKKPKEIAAASRCQDNFIVYTNQYHTESNLVAEANTVESCLEACLNLPRARCAAINYNKEGRHGNRCFMLEYAALEYNHGFYRGVDEYLRQMCDSVEVFTNPENITSTLPFSPSRTTEDKSKGSTTMASSTTTGKRTTACPVRYTSTINVFGVDADYEDGAKDIQMCLDACTAKPNCPAVDFDLNVGTCYVHRQSFDGLLYSGIGIVHYDRVPCIPKTTLPVHKPTLIEVLRTTTPFIYKRTTVAYRTTFPRITIPKITLPYTSPTTTTTTESTTTTTASTTTTTTEATTTTTTTATTTTTSPTSTTTSSTSTTTTPTSPTSTTSTSTLSTTTTAALPPLDTNCNDDLTIIIDTSGPSDGQNSRDFSYTINLIQNVINNLRIGQNEVRVSAIVFSTLAFTSFNLDRNMTKGDVLHSLGGLHFVGGLSNLPRAMRLWYDNHKPHTDRLRRRSNVIVFSDVQVSSMFDSEFNLEAARWRTLTITGELQSTVVSTPSVNRNKMGKFTPLHTFEILDWQDVAPIIHGIVSSIPCRDLRPLPFDRPGQVTAAPTPAQVIGK